MDICLEKKKKRCMSIILLSSATLVRKRDELNQQKPTEFHHYKIYASDMKTIVFLNSNSNARLFIEYTSVCFVSISLQ